MNDGQGGSNIGKILAWVFGTLFLLGVLCCGGFWMFGRAVVKKAEELQAQHEVVVGSGNAATHVRAVSGFTRIDAEGAVNIEVTLGDAFEVTVTGEDNIVPLITTTVRNGVLEIDSDGSYNRNLPLDVTITLPALDGIKLDGACRLNLSGFSGPRLRVDLEGASRLTVAGVVDDLDVQLDNAASADLSRLAAKRADVDVEGASRLQVNADEALQIQAEGASRVEHEGRATPIVETSGAARVTRTK